MICISNGASFQAFCSLVHLNHNMVLLFYNKCRVFVTVSRQADLVFYSPQMTKDLSSLRRTTNPTNLRKQPFPWPAFCLEYFPYRCVNDNMRSEVTEN